MKLSYLQLALAGCLLTAGSICNAASTNADFYLSTKGSDSWSGTLATPNAQRSDGPFATLTHARNAVRDLKARQPSKDIIVYIREGTYQLENTVVFGLEDSGVGDSTITYAAYPGETPVFSSGREIRGWKEVSAKLPGLSKEAQGNIRVANVSGRFFTLYDAEGLLPRARSTGFIPLEGGSRNRLHFPEGRLKNWPNVEDVEIIVRPHHAWIVNVLPLASVDEEKQMAHTSIDATYAMNKLHFLKTTESCWVENALEELDQPGEWVLNTNEGKVYLWPRSKSPVIAPQLIELLRIEGEIDEKGPKDIPVRNLCFRGLTFMHGDRYTLTQDDAGLQHDWDMFDKANAMLRLRGTEHCTIEQCRFAHSGSGAIRVDLHGMENEISGNHIEHMGGAGILLCGYGPGTKDVNRKNLIYNNHIHHTGRIYLHSPGIMVWQSGENRVANNLVHHTPYTGIILSGCMTDFFMKKGRELSRTIRRHEIGDLPKRPELEDVRPYLHTHDNLVEYNEIHHAMEMLGDGNAIYIRGAGAGNVIRRNYVHHLVAPMIMQCAIRTDGGQRDTLIAENLIYKCVSQGIMLKLNTRCENNIVADIIAPPRGYYLAVREGPMTGATIKRNILYSSSKECVFINELPPGKGRITEDRRGRKLAKAKDADTDYNIYYCAADPELGKTMLAKQQGDGVDAHSLAVDPLFVDPAGGDFSFQPDSPALALGIEPLDVSKMGRLDDRSLVISDGSHFVSKDHYPQFTWDRIPLYMHIRKATSYTDEEIAFLARFPLITFEKANGHQDHGSVEAGTLKAARAVKKINPNTTILYYRNVMVHYGGYAANKGLEQIPGALLRDQNGGTKLVRNRVKAYDLSNADLRAWWVDTCSSMTADPHIDGIFLDGNIKALEPGYLAQQIGAAKKKQTMDGYHLMMKQTREAIGPNELMIANILRARFENAGLEYLDYFDGSYLEGFFHNVGGAGYEEYVAKGIDAMQKAARQGKIIAFTTGFASPRNTSVMGIDETRATVGSHVQARAGLTYPLAIFLVCAEKHSYFRIHEGYSANENDRWMRWFPEYDRPLGPPNGPATKDGFRYSRTFRHATVQLDIQKRTASIQWQETATAHPLGAQTSKDGVTEMEPTWESLAANYQVPQWFVDGKIGIWMHWGIPSAVDENRPNDGSHYARRMYATVPEDYSGKLNMSQTLTKWHTERYGHPSEFGYEDLIPLFKAQKWDPDALVKFLKDNGARFIMPVACHHDNFDMYDSFHPWNSVKMGPKRDTLKEWKEAATKHGLKFGVSTHLYWSPRFLMAARKYQTPGTPEWDFFNMDYSPMGYASQDRWNEHWYARCWELIEKYDPDMFNNDSPYPRIGTGKGLGIKLFTDYLNRDLKENDGNQTVVLSFKDGNADRRAFTYNLERGSAADIKPEPWMWATDLSGGWFYRKGAVNRMSIPVMVGNAVDAISKNGVVMLNVALRGDGTLPEKQAAYLTSFGDFLRINGEGIYGTRPWKTFGEGPLKMKDGRQGENKKPFSQNDIRFTTRDGKLYVFVLAPPTEDIVIKTLASGGLLDREITGIELMGSDEKIKWKRSSNELTIQQPKTLPGQIVNGFRIHSK